MYKTISKEALMVDRPKWKFAEGVKLAEHIHVMKDNPQGILGEFIGTDSFASSFYTRQRYEVDAGLDEEPILYLPIYDVTEDGNLPRNVSVDRLGPAKAVFTKINEGGEVQFITFGGSSFSVPMDQYGVGLEYTKALVMFNETWNFALAERQVGTAHNALLNHLHFFPIIDYSYDSDNQTDGGALTYDPETDLPTAYLRTLEAAVTHASEDTAHPRRGPYALVLSTSNRFTAERALTVVGQVGSTKQSSVIGDISTVIVYNGWTGYRGKLVETYPGVTAGKAYLVNLSTRARNFRSFVKQGLQSASGNADVSRFILEQTVWDWWGGVYASPAEGVEEITWPTADDLS